MEPKITYNSVYYSVYYVVTDNPEHFLDPIAIRPTFYEYWDGDYSEKRCEWNDTSRGSHLFINSVVLEPTNGEEPQPREFKIIGTNGEIIRFVRLTQEIFQKNVVKHTLGQPSFNSDEELQQHYLNGKFSNL